MLHGASCGNLHCVIHSSNTYHENIHWVVLYSSAYPAEPIEFGHARYRENSFSPHCSQKTFGHVITICIYELFLHILV